MDFFMRLGWHASMLSALPDHGRRGLTTMQYASHARLLVDVPRANEALLTETEGSSSRLSNLECQELQEPIDQAARKNELLGLNSTLRASGPEGRRAKRS
jgi:hypothetical protein